MDNYKKYKMHIVGIPERETILETTITENFPQIHVRHQTTDT
jgi:hypothetical protein